MAGLDNLDLLGGNSAAHVHADESTHQHAAKKATCIYRHQILLDDVSELIVHRLKPVYGSMNAVIRAGLAKLEGVES